MPLQPAGDRPRVAPARGLAADPDQRRRDGCGLQPGRELSEASPARRDAPHRSPLPRTVLHARLRDGGDLVEAPSDVDADVQARAGRSRAAAGFSEGCAAGRSHRWPSHGSWQGSGRRLASGSVSVRARRLDRKGVAGWRATSSPARSSNRRCQRFTVETSTVPPAVHCSATRSQVAPSARRVRARTITERAYRNLGTTSASKTVIDARQPRHRRRGWRIATRPVSVRSPLRRLPQPRQRCLRQGSVRTRGGGRLATVFHQPSEASRQAGSGGLFLERRV